MDLIAQIRDKMTSERLMFVYRGVITNENSMPLLMLIEKEMENSEFGSVGRKRLFTFVLESLQNVTRHSDKTKLADMSMVVYSKANGGYTVTTGNVIPAANIRDLRSRLNEINNLDISEIRSVYRQMLANSELSSKGGAGLGLIEMAKMTGNKLDYDFIDLDNNNSYFILSKTVDKEGMGFHSGKGQKAFTGNAAFNLERLMSANQIYLMWSGHITSDVGKEVLSFTETKLTEADIESDVRRRVFSILVEILENVAKHGAGREESRNFGMPVMVLRYENNTYIISTGNLISNEKIGKLRAKLDKINSLDKDGLKELFKKALYRQTGTTESTGNMGLIDMARKSGQTLDYHFEKVNESYSYYTLRVRIEDRII